MNRTQKEYIRRINRVMDYIDRHLAEPLSLDRLAEEAAFSKYHFHRIFFALRGETPGQFIQRLRIEKAAVLLCSRPEDAVLEIALDSGFSDAAAFSRAFKAAHGVTPSAYRESRSNPGIVLRNSGTGDRKEGTAPRPVDCYDSDITESWRNDMKQMKIEPVPAKSVTIVERPETTVAYVRHTGPYAGDELLFQRLFTQLYNWAQPRNLITRGVTEEIVVYHDDPEATDPQNQRISCCISVPPETEVSGEVGKMTIDAGTFAEARFRIDGTQFGGAWNWVYGEWLPKSGYQPDDRMCFEKYADDDPEAEMNGTTGRTFVVDICVPVKPM